MTIRNRMRETASRFGWRQACLQAFHKALARGRVARFLEVLWMDREAAQRIPEEKIAGLDVRPLDAEELYRLARFTELELDASFIDGALANGDVCLGVHADGELAAYVWFGRRNMELYPGLLVSVADDVAYAYKGLTLPAYRGRHCLTACIRHAIMAPVLPGTERLVSLVEASNLVSRLATRRLGFTRRGWLCIAGRPPLRRWFFLSGMDPADRIEIHAVADDRP